MLKSGQCLKERRFTGLTLFNLSTFSLFHILTPRHPSLMAANANFGFKALLDIPTYSY